MDEDKINNITYNGKALEVIVTPYDARIKKIGTVHTPDSYTILGTAEHCCGASGYGLGPDDKCPGCEQEYAHSDILHVLSKDIKKNGGIKKYYESSSEMNIEHLMKDVVNDVFTISKKLPDVLKFKGRLDTIISDAFAESLKNIGEYPKIKDNQDLIDQYFSGVHVFIFKYQGKLFPFERSTIDQFASGWCGLLNGCNYIAFTELKTKNKYFEKINNAILLKDFYGQKVIHGLYDIQDYIQMIIHDPAYQKHIILPKMEHIKNKGTRNNVIL